MDQISIQSIKGKRILFFSPAFFHYETMIANKMQEMGAEVDMYDVRSVKSPWSRALLKVCPWLFNRKSQLYYEKILEQNKNKDYDYVLIVKCDMTPESILSRIKREYPHAKLCLNLWDSVRNIPGIKRKLKYFDTLHSFDSEDCKNYPVFQFRPLFFHDRFRKNIKQDEDYFYDICFLGTIHSDRFAVIRQMQTIAKQHALRCFWFLYLQSNFIFYFYKLTKKEFWGAPKNDFSFKTMRAEDIASIVDQSHIILDIQHPKQTGLTMRTIEMVGMNKKMITTNQNIKEYDFYHPNNILIIDRKNANIPENFLSSPYIPISQEVYENYSLRKWILDVLS